MGNTWEVWAWEQINGVTTVGYTDVLVCDDGVKRYGYRLIYAGESRREALRFAKEAKDNGAGCVRIEWR